MPNPTLTPDRDKKRINVHLDPKVWDIMRTWIITELQLGRVAGTKTGVTNGHLSNVLEAAVIDYIKNYKKGDLRQ